MIRDSLKPVAIALATAALSCAAVSKAVASAEPGEEVITLVLASGIAPPREAPPRGDEDCHRDKRCIPFIATILTIMRSI